MTSWIEPPPRQKGMGCLGKGCLLLICFIVLLGVAFVVGGYVGVRYVVTSTTPREIPQVETSEAQQQTVREKWDQFETANRTTPAQAPTTNAGDQPDAASTPSRQANRIELTASDINQLISGSRKMRGKVFVSIDDNVVRAQVSIPLEKVGFRGRFLNGDFSIRPAADRNPRNLQVTQISLSGVDVPEGVLKALLGARSLRSYVDEYASEYQVTTLTIEDNKVILEANAAP